MKAAAPLLRRRGAVEHKMWPVQAPRQRCFSLRLLLFLAACGNPSWSDGPRPAAAAAAASNTSNTSDAQWYLLPQDDLAVFEAFEYSMLRINEMRTQCGSGFNLAPLLADNYHTSQAYLKQDALFYEYRLHIEPKHNLAPSTILVHIARQKSITDLSLFQVIDVDPLPCALYSLMDDAELMQPITMQAVTQAQAFALNLLNRQRKVLCPQKPTLQLLRVLSASLQPVEGKVLRLVMEFREASSSFEANSFTDVIGVYYALDQDVPGQVTITPEVYPARPPCDMTYTEDEESAVNATTRRLEKSAERRALLGSSTGSSQNKANIVKDFVDKGLTIPDDFDPRLERTLCFPRGISRSQGSCGASWAFAATAVASFRECLYHLKSGDPSAGLRFLSAQELISCNPMEGCSGGGAAIAFFYMKHKGIAREACSPYRMRCFLDNSVISVAAADSETSQPKTPQFQENAEACPLQPDIRTSPCRCLPSVYHLSLPVRCPMLPNACDNVTVPHYFHIAGTAEGNSVAEIERHMMQEILDQGPLYVSVLMFEDMYDPVSWTESGIYIHMNGDLIGKHAVAAVGWGTDADSRDYWLLLNSMGSGWQQQGYFKVSRGETTLQMLRYGAWGVDMSHLDRDRSSPGIFHVEVTYSADMNDLPGTVSMSTMGAAWLEVASVTDEPARVMVRVQGLASTITGEERSQDYQKKHVHKVNLLKLGLLDERAKIEIWAVDAAQNSGNWGPFTFKIPSKDEFQQAGTSAQVGSRRLQLAKDQDPLGAEENVFI